MKRVPLTPVQRLLRRQCTRLLRVPGKRRQFNVELVVGRQGFRFGYDDPAPKADCEWMRDMMAKALSRIPGIVRKLRRKTGAKHRPWIIRKGLVNYRGFNFERDDHGVWVLRNEDGGPFKARRTINAMCRYIDTNFRQLSKS